MERAHLVISHASHPKRAEFHGSPIFGGSPLFVPTPFNAEDQIWDGNTWGGTCFQEVSHANVFAQIRRRAVCRRQLSSLYNTHSIILYKMYKGMCVCRMTAKKRRLGSNSVEEQDCRTE